MIVIPKGVRLLIPACIAMVLTVSPPSADAQERCTVKIDPHLVGEELATANIVDNLLSQKGSLRQESKRLLREAHRQSRTKPADARCPRGCALGEQPVVIFTSVPRAFLDEYEGKALCDTKLSETTETPFEVSERAFNSLDELYDWISDFSRGKGQDGARLYERCAGGCSPQYEFEIRPTEAERFTLNASVRCGHMRDREDNRYQLTAHYYWPCQPIAQD